MSWEAEPPGWTLPVSRKDAIRATGALDDHATAVGASQAELRQVLDSLFGRPRTDGETRRMQRGRERR